MRRTSCIILERKDLLEQHKDILFESIKLEHFKYEYFKLSRVYDIVLFREDVLLKLKVLSNKEGWF